VEWRHTFFVGSHGLLVSDSLIGRIPGNRDQQEA
jgi:hypothetical protein